MVLRSIEAASLWFYHFFAMPIKPEELIGLHPTLYHVSLASWEQVREEGLLSTSSLLDRYGYRGLEREKLETSMRPSAEDLRGKAWLNDQSPWNQSVQRRCQFPDGMVISDWLRYLNGHVFFWPTRKRLETFLAAKRAQKQRRIVVEVETRQLLDRVNKDVLLSCQNSGAPHGGNPKPRVKFVTMNDCPFAEWTKTRKGRPNAIVEVVTSSKASLKGLFKLSAQQPD